MQTGRPLRSLTGVIMLSVLVCGCMGEQVNIRIATTTSVEDSGLLAELMPALDSAIPDIKVAVLAVGSGQALQLARHGDVDVVIAHSPAAESAFVHQKNAILRCAMMRNDFVIVGPDSDPAGVAATRSAVEGFKHIAGTGAVFVSRGDSSGTHAKELSLWRWAGTSPDAPNYMEIGQGMAETLQFAAAKSAYTLADRGTYYMMPEPIRDQLPILLSGDSLLRNPYSVIVARRARHREPALQVARWFTSPEGQNRIGVFGRANGGAFEPVYQPCSELSGGTL